MKPLRTLLFFLLSILALGGNAQSLKTIGFQVSDDQTGIRSVSFVVDGGLAYVLPDGRIKIYPVPHASMYYYDKFDGKHKQDKLKAIETTLIDYYDEFDGEDAGKIKSIGGLNVSYNSKFDGFDNIGRVKAIGTTTFTYYDKFDGADKVGKLKSIGNIVINYYDHFDGSDVKGKIKSIGNTVVKYYDHFDGENAGRIKSINGSTPHVSIRWH